MLGGFFALCSAATFAFNNASVRRGVLTGTVVQAMAITLPIGVPISFLIVLLTGSFGVMFGFSPKALLALSASGIMHFVWGRYCNYRATRAIGTNLVAPIQQVNLILTLCLAIWLLGEELTPLRIVGIALVLLGPALTNRGGEKPASDREVSPEKITAIDAEKPAAFKPKYAEGYFFSLLSATGYGLSPILVRIGLENKGLSVSIAGNFVASLAATAVMGFDIDPSLQTVAGVNGTEFSRSAKPYPREKRIRSPVTIATSNPAAAALSPSVPITSSAS